MVAQQHMFPCFKHPELITVSERRSRHGTWRSGGLFPVAVLFLLVAVINSVWIAKDELPMGYGDPYWYLEKTLRFLDAPPLRIVTAPFSSLQQLSHAGRPPLYQLLSAPFLVLAGRTEDAARCVNLLFLAVLMATTYYTARLIKDGWAGLLAAFLVVCYPPILHLSRTYLPHSAAPACVSLSVCLLTLLLTRPSVKTAWLFGASLAFGALIHPEFLPLPIVPTAVAGAYLVLFSRDPKGPASLRQSPRWLARKLGDPFVLKGLVPAAAIAVGLTLAWYLTAGRSVIDLQLRLMQPSLAEFRGFKLIARGFPSVEPGFWWYARTAPGALSNVLSVFIVLGLVFGIIRRHGLTMFLVFWFLADYVLLGLNTTFCWWSFAAILPIAAVLTSVFVTGMRPKWLARGCTVLCVATSAFAFVVVTWGVPLYLWRLATVLGAEEKGCWQGLVVFCPLPAGAEDQPWPVKDMVEAVVRDQDSQEARTRWLDLLDIPGGKEGRCWGAQPCPPGRRTGVWAGVLNYVIARDWPSATLRVFGPNAPTWGDPYSFEILRADYILYEEQDTLPKWMERNRDMAYDFAVRKFLHAPPPAFVQSHERVATFQGPDVRRAALVKRVRPLTAEEAERSIAAIELSEAEKATGYSLLGALRSSAQVVR